MSIFAAEINRIMSIEVRNITKFFGRQKALDNVSFTIHPGEVVGLLGPNGAGKSTLMKIIACFIPPTKGDVFVDGMNIVEHSLDVRKKIGYLPENNPLYTDMYVKEYLEFIGGIYKIKDKISKRINKIIEVTGLELEQNKKINALSKGYKQRVGLAQALIHDPDVLILDEPTSGLDPNQLLEIRNLITEIGKKKTVILSTHIMQEVEAICQRAIIIDSGKIVADDLTSNLSRRKGNFEYIDVEFLSPIDPDIIKTISGVKEVTMVNERTFRIKSKTNTDIRPDIFNFAVKKNLTVISLTKTEQSLEKVFQQLTKK